MNIPIAIIIIPIICCVVIISLKNNLANMAVIIITDGDITAVTIDALYLSNNK